MRQLIAQRFGHRFSTVHVWRLLGQLGFSLQRPVGRACESDEAKIAAWKTQTWPRLEKARRERRTLVFLGESGLSQRPHRVRTWAPRGQTPVLTFNFNWKKLSAIAGLSPRKLHFRLHAGSIRSPQVIEFLQALHRQVPGKILLLWDGAPIHRSKRSPNPSPPYSPKPNCFESIFTS